MGMAFSIRRAQRSISGSFKDNEQYSHSSAYADVLPMPSSTTPGKYAFSCISSMPVAHCIIIVASVLMIIWVVSQQSLIKYDDSSADLSHECIGYCWSTLKQDARSAMSFLYGALLWCCVSRMCGITEDEQGEQIGKTINFYAVLLWCVQASPT